MSIYPKIAKKSKDNIVTLHMKVINNSDSDIRGYIHYKITLPSDRVEFLQSSEEEIVPSGGEINRYYNYIISDITEAGRYSVDGRFFWDEENILSETYNNDYFDVEE